MQTKNEAAADLARKRWAGIPPKRRSEIMRKVRAAATTKKGAKKP